MSVQFPASTFRLREFGNIQENSEIIPKKKCFQRRPDCARWNVLKPSSLPKASQNSGYAGNLAKSTTDVNLQYQRLFSSNRIFFLKSQNVDVALSVANNKMSSQKTHFTRSNKHLLSLVPRDVVNSEFKAPASIASPEHNVMCRQHAHSAMLAYQHMLL